MHQNTEEPHRTGVATKPSGYEHTSVSCIYEKEGTRAKPEQMQRHELSVNVPCCNIHLYPKENEHHPKMEANMTGNQGPKVLVEYDNFPPNKTIGPEMKVVIPPIPTQNNFNRSSPKDNRCQIQYQQVRPTGERFTHFSPIHGPEAQDFTDSDSDWENEAMAGFGGFMWSVIRADVKKTTCIIRTDIQLLVCIRGKMCIYCKIVIKLFIVKKKNIDLFLLLIKDQNVENHILLCNIMFNIKRRKHLYTTALRHSHIQLYKTEKKEIL